MQNSGTIQLQHVQIDRFLTSLSSTSSGGHTHPNPKSDQYREQRRALETRLKVNSTNKNK